MTDVAFWRQVPKGDLHAHLALSAPRAFYHGAGAPVVPSPLRLGSFERFSAAVQTYFLPIAAQPQLQRSLYDAALARMWGDGVRYVEGSWDLRAALALGWPAVAGWCRDRRRRARPRCAFELGISRLLEPHQVLAQMEPGLEIFDGIDLYDDERRCGLAPWRQVIARAQEAGVYVKVHAGELCGAAAVAEALELGITEIQHGITAVCDRGVLAAAASARCRFHVCPASNLQLGVWQQVSAQVRDHPLRLLAAAQVPFTLGSDDFAVLHVDVSRTYAELETQRVFTRPELHQIALTSLVASSQRL